MTLPELKNKTIEVKGTFRLADDLSIWDLEDALKQEDTLQYILDTYYSDPSFIDEYFLDYLKEPKVSFVND